eukprot:scaffold148_cov78-Phaeocystis_antarctica.AAC.11
MHAGPLDALLKLADAGPATGGLLVGLGLRRAEYICLTFETLILYFSQFSRKYGFIITPLLPFISQFYPRPQPRLQHPGWRAKSRPGAIPHLGICACARAHEHRCTQRATKAGTAEGGLTK